MTVTMRSRSCLSILAVCLSLRLFAADAALRTHDPSTIIRCNEKYWVFHTGLNGLSRFSTDLVHWQAGPHVFAAPLDWWKTVAPGFDGQLWAPDAIHIGDKYYLYYSVSAWGKRTSAICLATNTTLEPTAKDFRWEDAGIVIQTTEHDEYNAIDPGVMRDGEKLWLTFGSYWSGIKLIELDPRTGKRITADAPVHALAAALPPSTAIEAACLYKRGEWYYLFVNWGQCCQGVKSTYNVRVGRSRAVTGPYLDRSGVDMAKGGGTLFLESHDRYVGPGHIGIFHEGDIDWCSYHFYDANNRGRPAMKLDKLSWDKEAWPLIQTEEK